MLELVLDAEQPTPIVPLGWQVSVVMQNRASLPKPWRGEIYRAGRNSPIECSSVLYESMSAARRAGNEALKQLLTDFPA